MSSGHQLSHSHYISCSRVAAFIEYSGFSSDCNCFSLMLGYMREKKIKINKNKKSAMRGFNLRRNNHLP